MLTGRLLAFLALVVTSRVPIGENLTTAVRLVECWVIVALPVWLMNMGPVTVLFALVVPCTPFPNSLAFAASLVFVSLKV